MGSFAIIHSSIHPPFPPFTEVWTPGRMTKLVESQAENIPARGSQIQHTKGARCWQGRSWVFQWKRCLEPTGVAECPSNTIESQKVEMIVRMISGHMWFDVIRCIPSVWPRAKFTFLTETLRNNLIWGHEVEHGQLSQARTWSDLIW